MGDYEYTDALFRRLVDFALHIWTSSNKRLSRYEPLQLMGLTVCFTLLFTTAYRYVFDPREAFKAKIKKSFFRLVRKIPYIRRQIQIEVAKVEKELSETFNKPLGDMTYLEQLPVHGWSKEHTIKEAIRYKELADINWKEGKCSGTVYNGDETLSSLINQISGEYAWSNPLHADVFPGVRKMEAEVVRILCKMFNGNKQSCGTMTSGGTESIFMACKAYRDMAIENGIDQPNMVIPVTAHCAFDKAAGYLRMRVIHVPVDDYSCKVNVQALQNAINSKTCMIVVSAPHFPHGIIDPIEEISTIGKQLNIPVHVDCCLGGFLLPFMQEAGFKVPAFDFTLPGVTSISADTHKYGYAPKGSSVIMYRSKALRRHQYFVHTDWPGGIYASSSVAGSRSGSIIAGCWAAMMYTGHDGYVKATHDVLSTTKRIERSLREIDDIYVLGEPLVSVVAIASDTFDIYRLSDGMRLKGWNLNALQYPSSIHLCVTLVHTRENYADMFIKDIKDTIAEILLTKDDKCVGAGALYGMAQSIPDRSIVSEIGASYYDSYYNTTK